MRTVRLKRRSELPVLDFAGARMDALLDAADTESLACYRITLPGGRSVPAAYHKKAVEMIWGLSGKGVIEVGRRRVTLTAGDVLVIHPPTPHAFHAGRKPWTFLAVLSPRVDSRTDLYPVTAGTHGHARAVKGRWREK